MKRLGAILCLALAAVVLTGCKVRSVSEMYRLPKRSEDYAHLQTVIDGAMKDMTYCAPVSGEYQQTVQMADLDGDGEQEYLLFAKANTEHPLRILIFKKQNDGYVHTQTIQSDGTAFDQVGYAQMDDREGVELVFGCQISDQLVRSVYVYRFHGGEPEQVISADYVKYITADMDGDGKQELLVLDPGDKDAEKGVARLFTVQGGEVSRFIEVPMSQPVANLKRILVGKLYGGETAVFVASTADEASIVTDIFALVDGSFRNVALIGNADTNVKTQRNYYIYADDPDGDGITELPAHLDREQKEGKYNLLRWYSVTADGEEKDKLHTFHNFDNGWYLVLDSKLAPRLQVQKQGNEFVFGLTGGEKLFSVRSQPAQSEGTESDRCVLYNGESNIYTAKIEDAAQKYGITEQTLTEGFHLISSAWKAGE